MDKQLQLLIYKLIDGTIESDDFDRLQDAIEHDEEVRLAYLRSINLVDGLAEVPAPSGQDPRLAKTVSHREHSRRHFPYQWVVAALLFIAVGAAAFWTGNTFGPGRQIAQADPSEQLDASHEHRIAGHATLRRTIDAEWANGRLLRDGDVLSNEEFSLRAGIAEIEFFCGASLIVEGPASFQIQSDWSVDVARGNIRANVPPVAQGFTVNAAGSQIVDLGTEFAVNVEGDAASIQVIDGEVAIHGGEHDGKHLFTGETESLGRHGARLVPPELRTSEQLDLSRAAAIAQASARWKSLVAKWSKDSRTIAYYPIGAFGDEHFDSSRLVPNFAEREAGHDGQLVGPVEKQTGRFNQRSGGLEFERPGSRVRTRIDGEFSAFTFACWVRIDSLPNRYNALFMGDGYENGEPHWQIRDDGCLMFSVMVDDTQDIRTYNEREQRMVQQAGLHRVYYSEPFWDVTKAGQWFHLASVYSPATRQVFHYANGQEIGSDEIPDKFFRKHLSIGAGEIGNWGQPFRKSPWFSVRNLNGTIDELLICDAALSTDEIAELYKQGKPVGY